MSRENRLIVLSLLLGLCLLPTQASAWDPVKDLTGKRLDEHGKKVVKEIGNGVRDVGKEAEKLGKKTIKEIGNAGEDLRILVEEGKCGGDVCDALDAVVVYAEATIEDAGKSIEQAAKRIEEGKFIDAIWHLGTDPLNNAQENAAEAAARSSVLRAVGQVAAGAYGGPAGAAAYAAWLAYNMTDGDLGLALRAGVIAGATAYAMTEISGAQGVDVIQDVTIDETLQRVVMSGAVSGMAVAAAGGDQVDIENAITAGMTMAVIRDGYKELTKTNLEDNLKASTGEPYCLAADPNSGLDCLPPPEAYVRRSDGSISYRGGKPVIDVTRLDAQRPHVGMFAGTADDPLLAGTETSEFMKGVSKVPGMNAMAVGHDIADINYNRIADIPLNDTAMATLEMAVRVGTIAPSVVLTYEGAGYRVHEMIRNEIAETARSNGPNGTSVSPDSAAQGSGGLVEEGTRTAAEPDPVIVTDKPAVEIRNLVCQSQRAESAVFMETHLDLSSVEPYGRICSIYRHENARWRSIWHAHYETSFCIGKFNEMALSAVDRGMRCVFSVGLRYGDGEPVADIAATAK